ncbi:hypothetical protein HDE_11639 [Halotydeus destructor]|nr:hypothetical protein HDE_11639 [Halotydeus destructor]
MSCESKSQVESELMSHNQVSHLVPICQQFRNVFVWRGKSAVQSTESEDHSNRIFEDMRLTKLSLIACVIRVVLCDEDSDYRPCSNSGSRTSGHSWCDCGTEDATIRFSNVHIGPEPIVLGSVIQVESDVEVAQAVLEGSKSRLTVERVVEISRLAPPLLVPIMCIRGYGSCTKDLCSMMERSELTCSQLDRTFQCQCPLPTGHYRVTNVAYKVGRGDVARLFLAGKYKLTWAWLDQDDHQLGCLEVSLAITKDKQTRTGNGADIVR